MSFGEEQQALASSLNNLHGDWSPIHNLFSSLRDSFPLLRLCGPLSTAGPGRLQHLVCSSVQANTLSLLPFLSNTSPHRAAAVVGLCSWDVSIMPRCMPASMYGGDHGGVHSAQQFVRPDPQSAGISFEEQQLFQAACETPIC